MNNKIKKVRNATLFLRPSILARVVA